MQYAIEDAELVRLSDSSHHISRDWWNGDSSLGEGEDWKYRTLAITIKNWLRLMRNKDDSFVIFIVDLLMSVVQFMLIIDLKRAIVD